MGFAGPLIKAQGNSVQLQIALVVAGGVAASAVAVAAIRKSE